LGKLVLIRNFNKVLHGIDFRIKSGETYSETLEELSGGQKSIIALSFIFSLLLSKPAPFYILDEIDAALDLCHTQNIGKIIREYFSMSQFLVVSLKNGIITKADLIFKIKNIRGKSVITRITNKENKD
jgi:structural maintenance of chromosome 2